MHIRWLVAPLLAMAFAASPAAAAEDPAPVEPVRSCYPTAPNAPDWTATCIRQEHFFSDTCLAIQLFAVRHELPIGYFARLIWQESNFDPNALSIAGAQGIAQFMPSTARLRGLNNAFDPTEALAKSAEYLRFLTDKFGNLGLAAVAYNGGEGRAGNYVRSAGYLPAETRNYVEIITGLDADTWLAGPQTVDFSLSKTDDFITACVKMAEAADIPSMQRQPGEWHPWGVLLAQNFSQATAIRSFERAQSRYSAVIGDETLMLLQARNPNFGPRLRHFAMIGRDDRDAAEDLCSKLRRAGGSCIVRKN